MLRIVKSKKTEWEKLEALKQEKINSKATLEKLLEGASEMQREALLKGAEGRRQEALAMAHAIVNINLIHWPSKSDPLALA